MNDNEFTVQRETTELGYTGSNLPQDDLDSIASGSKHLMKHFSAGKIPYARIAAEGKHLYFASLTDGKVFKTLDFGGFSGCAPLGHTPTSLQTVVADQIARGSLTNSRYYSPERATLLANLFGEHGRFADHFSGDEYVVDGRCSGSEAVSLALQIVYESNWDYQARRIKNPQKTKVVAMKGAYHGSTFASKKLMDRNLFSTGLPSLDVDVLFVDFNDLQSLEKMLEEQGDTVLGLFYEPVQGDHGIIVPDVGYLTRLRELCDESEIIMVADEIKTFARTGTWFASYDKNQFVQPDIAVIGKSLGMGVVPASMVITRKDLTMHPYRGLSTFNLTPLQCTVIDAGTQEIADKNLLEGSTQKGEILLEKIEKGPLIKDVRGQGLMVGAELTDDASSHSDLIRKKLLENGLVVNVMTGRRKDGINRVLEIIPPLIITEEDCYQAAEIINNLQRKN